jgi:hypothetical protein
MVALQFGEKSVFLSHLVFMKQPDKPHTPSKGAVFGSPLLLPAGVLQLLELRDTVGRPQVRVSRGGSGLNHEQSASELTELVLPLTPQPC